MRSAASGSAATGISAGGTDDADGSGNGAAMSGRLIADSAISVTGKTAVGSVRGAACLAMAHQRTTSATPAAMMATGHTTCLDAYFKEFPSRCDESRQTKYSRSQKANQQLWSEEKRGPDQSAIQPKTKNSFYRSGPMKSSALLHLCGWQVFKKFKLHRAGSITKQYWAHVTLDKAQAARTRVKYIPCSAEHIR